MKILTRKFIQNRKRYIKIVKNVQRSAKKPKQYRIHSNYFKNFQKCQDIFRKDLKITYKDYFEHVKIEKKNINKSSKRPRDRRHYLKIIQYLGIYYNVRKNATNCNCLKKKFRKFSNTIKISKDRLEIFKNVFRSLRSS